MGVEAGEFQVSVSSGTMNELVSKGYCIELGRDNKNARWCIVQGVVLKEAITV